MKYIGCLFLSVRKSKIWDMVPTSRFIGNIIYSTYKNYTDFPKCFVHGQTKKIVCILHIKNAFHCDWSE